MQCFMRKFRRIKTLHYVPVINDKEMEKLKLLKMRILKGLTQYEIAVLANMDQTTYGRKENGISKITSNEWKKIASILDVPLKDIFEDDNKSILIFNEISLSSKIMLKNSSDYCNIPTYILETLEKYIEKLEFENKFKEEEIDSLKIKILKLEK